MSALQRKFDFFVGVPFVAALSVLTHRKAAPRSVPTRILVIRLAAFGDSVLIIPALRAMKTALPNAQIDWLCTSINQSLAKTVPYIHRTLLLRNYRPDTLLSLVKELRRESYDLVIDFEQWARGTALLAWATGAPERIGFRTPQQFKDRLFTQCIDKTFTRHERDALFELPSLCIPMSGARDLELWETPEGTSELLKAAPELNDANQGTTRILLHPGCGRDGMPREWPIEQFAKLAVYTQQKKAVTFYLSGGPDEIEKGRALARLIPGIRNLSGQLSWLATLSLVRRMDVLVSGNTGVMHVAAAWKIRQIALHGPTDPRLWGPLNENAVVIQSKCPQCPCLRLGFEYHRNDDSCMRQIDPAEVYAAMDTLLSVH